MSNPNFLLTGRSAASPGASAQYDQVLVWAHGLGIGDFVSSIPLFRALRAQARELHLATDPGFHLLVAHERIFDALACELSPPPLPRYDLLVEIASHSSKLMRSPVVVERHLAFSTKDRMSSDGPSHRYLQEQLRNAGLFVPDARPSLDLSPADRTWASHALSRQSMGEESECLRVGMHVGAGSRKKLWPISRFAALADRLHEMFEARIALFFGPSDMDLKDEMVDLMDHAPAVVVQECNLAQISALIERMDLFISCDSGLMHLADALEVPLVAIFGPTHPRTCGPTHEDSFTVFSRPRECGGCGDAGAGLCEAPKCLEEVSVETVLVHIDRAIDRAVSRHRGPRACHVWNEQSLEHRAPHHLRRFLAAHSDLVTICRAAVSYSREQLADTLHQLSSGNGFVAADLVDDLCLARMLVPTWYPKVQRSRQRRLLSLRPRPRSHQLRPHLLFAVARETDASEMLTLMLNLPDSWDASVLVSRRHPVMGALLSRYAIPYQTYESTEDFNGRVDEMQPEVIVWASHDNMDRFQPNCRHVFVDHGMPGKAHFMSNLKKGDSDLGSFSMVCMPNRFTYFRTQNIGYPGRLELTGYLKGDIYHGKIPYPREEVLRSLELDPDRPLAVYCPTDIGWVGTRTCGQHFRWVVEAAETAGVNLIIRPHEEDYFNRPWILEEMQKSARPGQCIVLDWDSPLWVSIADVFVGDASSTDIEAVMAGIPAVLVPAAAAPGVDGSDSQAADLHLQIIHNALPVASSPDHLVELFTRPPLPRANPSLITYFNEHFDGQVHVRFFEALDQLMAL